MRAIIVCLVIVAVSEIFAGPVKPSRKQLEELNADHKRFIYVEDKDGDIELVDLFDGEITVQAAITDVTYYLYTPTNVNDPYIITNGDVSQLNGSPFDPSRINLFISHGWNNDHTSAVNTLITAAALPKYNLNVFVVDWGGLATLLYLQAQAAACDIGGFEGDFINQIQNTYGLSGSSFYLVGHSLGAHVAGCAGAIIQSKVDHIVGMDPAEPLYSLDVTNNRLDPSDGNFVQIIHTNGGLLGFSTSIGNADYYPNGGMNQPGCGLDLTGSCSHGRSYRYYAESITRGNVFTGYSCGSYEAYQDQACNGNSISHFGQIEIDKSASGDYFLNTNEEEPYGQG